MNRRFRVCAERSYFDLDDFFRRGRETSRVLFARRCVTENRWKKKRWNRSEEHKTRNESVDDDPGALERKVYRSGRWPLRIRNTHQLLVFGPTKNGFKAIALRQKIGAWNRNGVFLTRPTRPRVWKTVECRLEYEFGYEYVRKQGARQRLG